MKVRDAMNKNVVVAEATDSIESLLKKLAENHISGVPVVDGKKVVGIISESDVLEVLELEHLFLLTPEHLEKIKDLKVKAVMRREIFAAHDDEEVEEAARTIDKKNVNRLPVFDEKENLVGIITRGDIIRAFARSLGKHLLADQKEAIVLETDADRLLQMVKERGLVGTEDIAKDFGVSKEKIEKWVKILQEHGLVEIDYRPDGKSAVRLASRLKK